MNIAPLEFKSVQLEFRPLKSCIPSYPLEFKSVRLEFRPPQSSIV